MDSGRDMLGRRMTCVFKEPSSMLGMNSLPRKGKIARVTTRKTPAEIMTTLLCWVVHLRTGRYIRLVHLMIKLSFSSAALRKKEQSTGMTKMERRREDRRAITTVKARG